MMRTCASPSSSIFSPAWRSGAALDRHDLLASTGPPDLVVPEAEVGRGDLVDRLVLGRHDPLERGVARLHDAGGDADDRRERRLDGVVAGFGLALDGDLAVTDFHVLGEGERRPAEQLGDLAGEWCPCSRRSTRWR